APAAPPRPPPCPAATPRTTPGPRPLRPPPPHTAPHTTAPSRTASRIRVPPPTRAASDSSHWSFLPFPHLSRAAAAAPRATRPTPPATQQAALRPKNRARGGCRQRRAPSPRQARADPPRAAFATSGNARATHVRIPGADSLISRMSHRLQGTKPATRARALPVQSGPTARDSRQTRAVHEACGTCVGAGGAQRGGRGSAGRW
ncbi:hypothetical protein B0H17DRAFT_1094664, partial [Mycena rosella]